MMANYRNAPLVELIVQLRWDPVMPALVALAPTFSHVEQNGNDSLKFEEFASKFSTGCFNEKISHVERIFPQGFPSVPGQVVMRFKESPSASELYQIGAGTFTANAVPPYDSWTKFKPFLNKGIELLLEARPDPTAKFTALSLQYIDAYTPDLRGGLSIPDFIQKVLGYRLALPTALDEIIDKEIPPKFSAQFAVKTEDGYSINVHVGEGQANGTDVALVQTNVIYEGGVDSEAERLIEILDRAKQIQRSIFDGTTADIQDRMK